MDTFSTKTDSKVRYKDYGILILRLGIGLILLMQFAYYFLGKAEVVQDWGNAVWLGVVLLLLVFLGDIAFMLGYYTRFVAAFLAMIFAASCVFQLVSGRSYVEFSNDFMMCIIFIASIYLGGGKLSLDYKTNHYKIRLEGSGAL